MSLVLIRILHTTAQAARFFSVAAVTALVIASQGILPSSAQAQDAASPRFAIIDVQQVLRESTAVKNLNREIEKLRGEYQAELRKKEELLRTADQELSRQRTILSAEIFAKKRQELEQNVATLQREVQGRKRALDRGFSNGLTQVQSALAKIASEIAQEMNLDLIFSKATVVIVKPEFEITVEASKRLNKRLPSVAVELPKN